MRDYMRPAGIGLTELKARAVLGECPFCGEPLAKRQGSRGAPPVTCGDDICKAAYKRYWNRDRARGLRQRASRG